MQDVYKHQLMASKEFFERSTRVLEEADSGFSPKDGTMTVAQQVKYLEHLSRLYDFSFPRLSQYTGLQVTDAPGLPIIWSSFALMLGGLLVRLYVRPLLEWRAGRKAAAAPVTGAANVAA